MSEQERETLGESEETEVEGHGLRALRRDDAEPPANVGERSESDDDPDVEGHIKRKLM